MTLPTLPADKANHLVYGAAIFAVTYVLMSVQALPALPIAAGAVVLLAIAKELNDYLQRATHTPDPLDALATVAGGALVALPLIIR